MFSGVFKDPNTYANPIVVAVSSATGRAFIMLHQTGWCYSELNRGKKHSLKNVQEGQPCQYTVSAPCAYTLKNLK